MKIAVLQGPNLNRLGTRKPEVYGTVTLPDIVADLDVLAEEIDIELLHFQSNHEGAMIDWLQSVEGDIDGVVCNPAGLTNYGLSLRDALNECGVPVAIIHLSNVHAREEWRKHDVFAEIAKVYFAGAGWRGYRHALQALVAKIGDQR
jgi:3-dehydroquinate dehydratase-2